MSEQVWRSISPMMFLPPMLSPECRFSFSLPLQCPKMVGAEIDNRAAEVGLNCALAANVHESTEQAQKRVLNDVF